MLVVLALVPELTGKGETVQRAPRYLTGEGIYFHKGKKNTRRIEKFLRHIMDKQAKLPDFCTSVGGPAKGSGAVESRTHWRSQYSNPPADGSIEPLRFSPSGSIAVSSC